MNDRSISSLFEKNWGHRQSNISSLNEILSLCFVILTTLSLAGCNMPKKAANTPATDNSVPTSLPSAGSLPSGWIEKVSKIVWVDYTPSVSNPNVGVEATADQIRADLTVLREAGFNGLITYSSEGIVGSELPDLAQEAGFEGMIMGIWDPSSQLEFDTAVKAAQNGIVLGYCIGNEGLNKPGRYDLSTLSASIQKLREATGKPVTTTEEIDDYYDAKLLELGDWIFPNAHPYYHHQFEANSAVRWTEGVYDSLKMRTDRFVLLKEVGMPTTGDTNVVLTEESQKQYFSELAKTNVKFAYFEAFDQPWRPYLPIEAHWGIFNPDRSPKLLGWQLIGKVPPAEGPDTEFYIYKDADSPDNHFTPSGYMGDTGDIHINEAYTENPYSGSSAIQVVYDAAGAGPYTCEASSSPCKWSGVYWLEPPKNWGVDPALEGLGFDLSKYSQLKLWARADRSCMIQFLVGGIDKPYGDSLKSPKKNAVQLTPNWQEITIDLRGTNLSHIIGGFAWVADWDMVSNKSCTFYLDDIRFEK